MKKNEPEEKIIDLLHGKLSPGEAGKVIAGLREAGIGDDEIESVRKVSRLIDEAVTEEPSSKMDSRFYEMLADERNAASAQVRDHSRSRLIKNPSLDTLLKVAAGIALFLMGWFGASIAGQRFNQNQELADLSGRVTDLKETLVLTLMQQNSTLERIKAVNMANEFENADERIIEGLLAALNHDENDNVRLLALEALIRYSDNAAVRAGLVASIRNQSSPMLQLRLAEVMVALNERTAASEFQKVLTDAALNYSVRNKINEAVTVLL
jgi:hypothetical protein